MKSARKWNTGSITGKLIIGFVLTLMIGSINVAPAFSKDDYRRMENNDNDRYEQREREHDQNRYERNRHKNDRDRDRYERERRGGYERPIYEHRRRGYEPPPVIYVPPPAPGVRIFFPPIEIHP